MKLREVQRENKRGGFPESERKQGKQFQEATENLETETEAEVKR
uniref:Uncharacterized protein n=1 Tax=Rhizophora mucronata TaxID=61149 RepID=A0A2P2QSL8_RHIMU